MSVQREKKPCNRDLNVSGSLELTATTIADQGEWLVTGALGEAA